MPEKGSRTNEEYARLMSVYEEDLMKFQEGEIEARSILAGRISREICPPNVMSMAAKKIYEHVLSVREEGANTPWEMAVRNLLNTRLTTSSDGYCNEFMQHYLDLNNAAEIMSNPNVEGLSGDLNISYEISAGLAGFLFVMGTEGVDWLDTWRQTKVFDTNNSYVSLDIMMSTLRQVAKGRETQPHGHGQAAVVPVVGGKFNGAGSKREGSLDPESLCTMCRHKHRNKNCFKQHPELRKLIKKKHKAKAARRKIGSSDGNESSVSDEFCLSAVARASTLKMNERLLYDTGASHHFFRHKSDFVNLKKLSKPFEFDQAVGNHKLSHHGTCHLQIGSKKVNLHNVLYSPGSSCNIVSAVRLKNDHGIVASRSNEILVLINNHGPDIPIAKLKDIEGVLFIQPYDLRYDDVKTQPIIAPGVARLPTVINAQRWHQRLGHVGQRILKETAQCSIGLEGIDLSELSTCETCHLSKAQRYVSRDKRPTPGEPLDEIFVDTVGKLTTALNGAQYAVILTDAKTRMRWVIITKGKDEIADQLVNWVEYQTHQYGKRIRTVFRDEGSEYMRAKKYCDEHGIRTDVSAPHTPEQNGAAEAANKVIL